MATKLLINEPPLQVLPTLACWVGLNEALVLQQIHYWLGNPKIGKTHEGRKWVRNTVQEWKHDNFPFWSPNTIRRAISNLEEDELINSTSALNKLNYDKTKWYTIDYDRLAGLDGPVPRVKKAITQIGQRVDPLPKMGNAITQNGQSDLPKMGKPIPETTPETTPESRAGEKTPPATPPEPVQEEDGLDAYFGPSPRNGTAPQKKPPPRNADEARARTIQAITAWQQARDGEAGAVRAARERLADSGWVPRSDRVVTQVVLFMAHTHFKTPPAPDGQRKAWYKALREHADQWSPEESADLYGRADAVLFPPDRDRPSDWRPPGGPWGYTKTMAGLAADENGKGGGGYVPPGVDPDLYRKKLERDGIG